MGFERLIRFEDEQGDVHYGNLAEPLRAEQIIGREVRLVTGSLEEGFEVQRQTKGVKKLLAPIESTPLVLCVGLNYELHSNETNFPKLPVEPVLFATPADRLTGPLDDVPIPPLAQSQLDYEGELTVVISKDVRDVSEQDALDYVLGYTVGNDVSARSLLPTEISGMQMGYCKSFDFFGPIGPSLVSPTIVRDPQTLQLVTKVNGEVRQNANTSEMLFSVRRIIARASAGRTLRRGTVIMTGTPEGVGWFADGLLKDGDVVEISIDEIGTISNRMVWT